MTCTWCLALQAVSTSWEPNPKAIELSLCEAPLVSGALPLGQFGDCGLNPLPSSPMQLFGGGATQLTWKCLYTYWGGCKTGEGVENHSG